jgi:predicted molibdopterin-dependent oxidoreductase YjgC
VYATTANEQGAAEIGFLPGKNGLNTRQILEACVSGEIKFLWLAGVDLFTEFGDRKLVESALESVEFLVVQDVLESETVGYSSVVLPATAPSETDGTYTNLERRVQRSKPVLTAPGESKPVWRAVAELSLRIKPEAPRFNAGEVMDRIVTKIPAFAKVSYATLEDGGQILE